jgi:hypothetical protein
MSVGSSKLVAVRGRARVGVTWGATGHDKLVSVKGLRSGDTIRERRRKNGYAFVYAVGDMGLSHSTYAIQMA